MKDAISQILAEVLARLDETRDETQLVVLVTSKSKSGTVRLVEADQRQTRSTQKADMPKTVPVVERTKEEVGEQVRFYSYLERAILRACTTEWKSSAELAAEVGEELDKGFYALLRNLSERGALEANRRHGYRLPGNEDAEGE